LRVFENKLLRKVFGPNREKVTEGFKKLYCEELCNLCCPPNFIRVIKSGRVSHVREVINAYKIIA
jgi:hypothetical protein